MRLPPIVIRLRQRHGTVAVMTAIAMPALLGAAALALDVGFLYRQSMRLQLAADAGAMGAARLLPADTTGTSAYQAAALIEVNGVTGGTIAGTVRTPVSVSVASNWTTVTVTLISTPSSFFGRAVGYVPSTISASATAGATVTPPAACVLALSQTASPAIQIDNEGSIVATGCPIFSDSTNAESIYLNSGTLSGSSIGAAGGVVKSNSGSNVMSPGSATSYAASESAPAALTSISVPSSSYATCNHTNLSDTSYGTYALSAGVYCGNTTVGGNGSSDSFGPGTYYIVNGNLVFNNANVTSASGVSFVFVGSTPGSFQWTNYSNNTTMTASTSGTFANVLIYQACGTSGTDTALNFNGGGTLQASGSIYAPCGALDINNNAKLTAASGSSFGVVVNSIYATGSAALSTSASGSGSSTTTTTYTLLQ